MQKDGLDGTVHLSGHVVLLYRDEVHVHAHGAADEPQGLDNGAGLGVGEGPLVVLLREPVGPQRQCVVDDAEQASRLEQVGHHVLAGRHDGAGARVDRRLGLHGLGQRLQAQAAVEQRLADELPALLFVLEGPLIDAGRDLLEDKPREVLVLGPAVGE